MQPIILIQFHTWADRLVSLPDASATSCASSFVPPSSPSFSAPSSLLILTGPPKIYCSCLPDSSYFLDLSHWWAAVAFRAEAMRRGGRLRRRSTVKINLNTTTTNWMFTMFQTDTLWPIRMVTGYHCGVAAQKQSELV